AGAWIETPAMTDGSPQWAVAPARQSKIFQSPEVFAGKVPIIGNFHFSCNKTPLSGTLRA
ncbi:MAG TPA: hypothetical protein PKM67_02580, partial [Kiritimatiellia bacterium]|nr:hypothetical protein [Kiritimatiellia bacterium]HNS80326.1 hypothetical protein [Kiritimatiellia bacterium]